MASDGFLFNPFQNLEHFYCTATLQKCNIEYLKQLSLRTLFPHTAPGRPPNRKLAGAANNKFCLRGRSHELARLASGGGDHDHGGGGGEAAHRVWLAERPAHLTRGQQGVVHPIARAAPATLRVGRIAAASGGDSSHRRRPTLAQELLLHNVGQVGVEQQVHPRVHAAVQTRQQSQNCEGRTCKQLNLMGSRFFHAICDCNLLI